MCDNYEANIPEPETENEPRDADTLAYAGPLRIPPTPALEVLDDNALIILYHQGVKKAFDALYVRYSNRLYAYLLIKTCNSARAEDVSQTTWLKAIKTWGELATRAEAGEITFFATLCTIARNTWLDIVKSSTYKTPPLDNLLFGDKPDAPVVEIVAPHNDQPEAQFAQQQAQQQLGRELAKALSQLEVKYREVLWLYYLQGWTVEEITEYLAGELKPDGVRARIRRAKELLRNIVVATTNITQEDI